MPVKDYLIALAIFSRLAELSLYPVKSCLSLSIRVWTLNACMKTFLTQDRLTGINLLLCVNCLFECHLIMIRPT